MIYLDEYSHPYCFYYYILASLFFGFSDVYDSSSKF